MGHDYPGHVPAHRPVLILTASMGDGHTAVADELARRMRERGRSPVVRDVLRMLPAKTGAALRVQYELLLRFRPDLYDAVYGRFHQAGRAHRTVAPVTALLRRAILAAVAAYRPRAVVSTFHLAGAAAGQLRASRRLRVPSIVVVTEFAGHELWLAPHTDLFVCPSRWLAARAQGRTGRPALAPGPVVAPRFRADPSPPDPFPLPPSASDRPMILIGAGAWGTGDIRETARALCADGRFTPVALCGRNDRLRRALTHDRTATVLGWQPDLAPLLGRADVLIDNAGGQTCCEAFATRTPVLIYRPLPGHGRAATALLAHKHLVRSADGPSELLRRLAPIAEAGPVRGRQTARAAGLFRGDAAEDILTWLDRGGAAVREFPGIGAYRHQAVG